METRLMPPTLPVRLSDFQSCSQAEFQYTSPENQTLLEKSLRCKLTVEKDTWVTGEPAFATVEIENISYENLDTAVLSSFRLERKRNIEPEESSNEEDLSYQQRY